MRADEGFHIERIHQVAQRATNLDESVAFYRDVLGLKFIASFDPPGFAFFDLDGTRLLLEGPASSALLYLRVPDIQVAYEALSARGVTFETDPHVVFKDDDGQFGPAREEEWMAFFRDPSDNLMAIASRERTT
ncbi:MAG: VOC family protein [Chloroflexi bacterium]|nr:VOC family protein [Chloroflexota bacterium]